MDWESGHHVPLGYHRILLEDHVRMDAYERAIRALVKPGDVVLDVGTGTGILAMLAARAGARRVHAIESADVAGLAEQIVRANELDEVVRIHRGDARNLMPVEPVDVLISECMGRFLIDDGMIPAVVAAGRRLKPGGVCCPRRVRLHVAPVGDLRVGALDVWSTDFYGLDFSAALDYAKNFAYQAYVTPDQCLAETALYHEWTLPGKPDRLQSKMCFEVSRSGSLRAVVGWWEAQLSDAITLSTGPGQATHWGQYLFPLPQAAVEAGDRLEIELWFDWEAENWRWEGVIARHSAPDVSFQLEAEQRLGQRNARPALGPAEDGSAWNLLGADAFTAQNYTEAATAFARATSALGAADEDAEATFENLGVAYVHSGELKAAVRALLRALDGRPESREQSLRLLINALFGLGRSAQATELLAIYRATFGAHPDWN